MPYSHKDAIVVTRPTQTWERRTAFSKDRRGFGKRPPARAASSSAACAAPTTRQREPRRHFAPRLALSWRHCAKLSGHPRGKPRRRAGVRGDHMASRVDASRQRTSAPSHRAHTSSSQGGTSPSPPIRAPPHSIPTTFALSRARHILLRVVL
eukprot:scaffold248121_cov28-Tisochrysis_lutea.AAC.3